MNDVNEFVTAWASTISAVVLVGVTVWYAFQTQSMAKSARRSAESALEAAQHSSRAAAIAAAGTTVDFSVTPTYAVDGRGDGFHFKGVRVECSGAAVYVHRVEADEVWALDPEAYNTPTSYTAVEVFADGKAPALIGLEQTSTLMHGGEFVFLEFPRDKWSESDLAALTVHVEYSFDGMQPVRRRSVEWETDAISSGAEKFDA